MALFLKAQMKCDIPECDYSEEISIQLDLAEGVSLFLVGDMPAPKGWEFFVRLGVKYARCPDCIAEQKRGRLKVVNDEPTGP